jgi:hypothetical protein
MACKMLVNRVVYDFPNAVVKGCSVVRVAEIHPWAFPYGLKALENLDAGCAVFVCQNYSSDGVF